MGTSHGLRGGQAEEKCPSTKAVGKSAILPSLCPFLKLLLNKKSHPFRVFRGVKKLALGVFNALTPLLPTNDDNKKNRNDDGDDNEEKARMTTKMKKQER